MCPYEKSLETYLMILVLPATRGNIFYGLNWFNYQVYALQISTEKILHNLWLFDYFCVKRLPVFSF